jgi:hypothetical protein
VSFICRGGCRPASLYPAYGTDRRPVMGISFLDLFAGAHGQKTRDIPSHVVASTLLGEPPLVNGTTGTGKSYSSPYTHGPMAKSALFYYDKRWNYCALLHPFGTQHTLLPKQQVFAQACRSLVFERAGSRCRRHRYSELRSAAIGDARPMSWAVSQPWISFDLTN